MNRSYIAARAIAVAVAIGLLGMQLAIALTADRPFAQPVVWAGLGITAVLVSFLLPVVWFTFRPPRMLSRQFRDAKAGVGTVVSAWPTGDSVGGRPEFELVVDVEAEDGRTFRSTTKEIVEAGAAPRLTPGTTLPVAYLPDGRIALRAVT